MNIESNSCWQHVFLHRCDIFGLNIFNIPQRSMGADMTKALFHHVHGGPAKLSLRMVKHDEASLKLQAEWRNLMRHAIHFIHA